MYQRLMGNVRRLKNIDGTTTKIAYAQIPINYNFGCAFSNTKTNDNEFEIEKSIPIGTTNSIKTNIMCNVIKILLPNNLTNSITISSSGESSWHLAHDTEIGKIPDLKNETDYNLIYTTFNNIQNKTIRKTLKVILYNLTHGNSPYANVSYQTEKFDNIFATNYDSDAILNTRNGGGYSIVNGITFPQPYLIFYHDRKAFNFIGYINTTPPNQLIELDSIGNTLPTYGIFLASTMNVLNVYYCTYKGV